MAATVLRATPAGLSAFLERLMYPGYVDDDEWQPERATLCPGCGRRYTGDKRMWPTGRPTPVYCSVKCFTKDTGRQADTVGPITDDGRPWPYGRKIALIDLENWAG